MSMPNEYPWTLNLVWKLLHNDRGALSLFANNPFPDKPPRLCAGSLVSLQICHRLEIARRQLVGARPKTDLAAAIIDGQFTIYNIATTEAGWLENENQ